MRFARVPLVAWLPVRIEDRQALADRPPVARGRPEIESIDVTDLIVKPFGPDDTTLKVIEDMRMQDQFLSKNLRVITVDVGYTPTLHS